MFHIPTVTLSYTVLYVFNTISVTPLFTSFDNKSIDCYRYQYETLPILSPSNVRRGKSIFFLETSCNSYLNGKIVIMSRQACAVESAALLNPDLDVYLLYTSPGLFKFEGSESDRFLQALLNYRNIKIRHINYESYTEGTDLEELYINKVIESSDYPVHHASDVLRLLTLRKFGGIYLDLDVIVLRTLGFLPPNFVGCEDSNYCTNSVLGFNFNTTEATHNFVAECLAILKNHFKQRTWGGNGPGVITRVVKSNCNVSEVGHAFNKVCKDLKIFNPNTFYPIHWRAWQEYFDEKNGRKVIASTLNSFVIHVWNRLSSHKKLPLNSRSAYSTLAKRYCPKVFQQCDDYF